MADKVKIQNRAMRGQKLSLRYTRDRDGRPVMVECDDEGCIEVPEDEAKFLLGTPGWSNPSKRKAPRPPQPSAPTRARTVQEGPQNAPPPKPDSAPSEGEELDVEAQIEGLRTKADAIKFASTWRAEGYEIPELDADTMKLREMKEALGAALLEDEGEGEG